MILSFQSLKYWVIGAAIALGILFSIFIIKVSIHLWNGGIPIITFRVVNHSGEEIKNMKIMCTENPILIPIIMSNDEAQIEVVTHDGGEGCNIYADMGMEKNVLVTNEYFSPGLIRIEINSLTNIKIERIDLF